MRLLLFAALAAATSSLVLAGAAAETETSSVVIPLYNGPAPVGDGTTQDEAPEITVYQPAHPNGAAMVICPGGGYGGLVIGPEGHGIAQWLNAHGITGVVLKYRLPRGHAMVPLLDAQQAIRLVRARSNELG